MKKIMKNLVCRSIVCFSLTILFSISVLLSGAVDAYSANIPDDVYSKEDQVGRLFTEGIGYYKNGQYRQASAVFEKVLFLDPSHRKAKVYLKTKIPQKVYENKKGGIKELYRQAYSHYDNGNYEQAKTVFEEIRAIDPTQKKAKHFLEVKLPQMAQQGVLAPLYSQAIRYFERGDYETAEGMFEEILVRDPYQQKAKEYLTQRIPQAKRKSQQKRIGYLYGEAQERLSRGNFEGANKAFKEILSIDPSQEKAKKYVEEIIPQKTKANIIASLYDQAIAYYKKGYYERANTLFEKILYLDPNEAKAREYVQKIIPTKADTSKITKIKDLYQKASEYHKSGDYDAARDVCEEILVLDPGQQKARQYIEVNSTKIATKKEVEPLLKQAVMYYETGKYDEATDAFNEVLSRDPDNRKAKTFLKKKIPSAMSNKDAHMVKSLYRKAFSHFNRQNYDEATQAFREILEINPEEERAQLYLNKIIPEKTGMDYLYKKAYTYYYNEDYKNAKYAFQQILQLDPTQKKAREYLQRKIPVKLRDSAPQPYKQSSTILDEEAFEYNISEDDIIKEDSSGFVVIKSRGPLEILEDADYLYQKGEYEEALVFYHEAYTQADDPLVKKRAKMARDVVEALYKAERQTPGQAAGDVERAVKIRERLKKRKIIQPG